MVNNRKIPHLNLIPILIIAFLLFKAISNIEFLAQGFWFIMSILSPFFWAFGVAYILNPLMLYFEKQLKLTRFFSISLVYILVLGFIILTITILTPTISNNIGEIVSNMPLYIKKTQLWFDSHLSKFNLANNQEIINYINRNLNNIADRLTSSLNSTFNFALTKAIAFTSSFIKMIFGFIISVYILKDKENFIRNIKRLLYAVFDKNSIDSFLIFGAEVNSMFSRYIIGKTIDSLIIGILCAAGLTILDIPYSLLISFIVGVTNMIPYFGPFIGMIPAFLITLFYDPIEALKVLGFILLLQQFDGWYLGPKILGEKVGVSPFWIILAVILGGGTFGVLGMFLGVPAVAILKVSMERYISKRLTEKNIRGL